MPNPFRQELERRQQGGEVAVSDNPFRRELQQRQPDTYTTQEMLGDVGSAIGGALKSGAQSVYGMIKGGEDLAPDVPGFTGEGLGAETLAKVQRAKAFSGIDDESFERSVHEALRGKIKSINPKNKTFTYVGDDGKEYTTQINKPGLDWQDTDRFISSALPYLATAGALGTFFKGASLPFRMLIQGGGQAGTDLGVQTAEQGLGGKDEYDFFRSAIVGGSGALGESLSPMMSWLGRNIRARNVINTETGLLTEKGRKMATKAGLDPDQLDQETTRLFQVAVREGFDPGEAVIRSQAGDYDIPVTRGQATKDPEQLLMEKGIRQGQLGPEPKQELRRFDEAQTQAIKSARDKVSSRITGDQTMEDDLLSLTGRKTLQETGISGQSQAELGERIQAGAQRSFQAADDKVTEAYKGLNEDAVDLSAGFQSLKKFTQPVTRNIKISERDTPAAMSIIKELEDFIGGKALKPGSELLAEGKLGFETVRQRINSSIATARNDTDRMAATRLKGAYDDWIQSMIDDGLAKGDPNMVSRFVEARAFNTEKMKKFTARGPRDFAGKRLERILKEADTGEDVVDEIFGATVTSKSLRNTVTLIDRMKNILDPQDFQAVKAAYWRKITTGPNGEVLSPQKLVTAIKRVREKQGTVLNALFGGAERAEIRRFMNAVEMAIGPDPNPPGTATAAKTLVKKANNNLLVRWMRRESQAAVFDNKPVKGTFLFWLANKTQELGINPLDFTKGQMMKQAAKATQDRMLKTGERFGSAAGVSGFGTSLQD